jgi:uncharacterized protein YbaR (Trm112 family)
VNERWLDVLRSPSTGAPFDLDAARRAGPELVEGFLVSRDERAVHPLLAGVAVLPPDVLRHLKEQGAVYWRTPILDPRVGRFVLGRAGRGTDVTPFEEVVRRYGDLLPPDDGSELLPMAAEDVALGRLLVEHAPASGLGLDVGCGVGRGVFVLAARLGEALGIDRSLACVRRARNVAVTREDFFLPRRPGTRKEVAVDLSGLHREGTDFAVGDAACLPLGDAAFDVVVLRAGDGRGAWAARERAVEEATRVLAPRGLLVLDAALPAPGAPLVRLGEAAPFSAWSVA